MKLLQSLLVKEGRMKNAASDLIHQAAQDVPKIADAGEYLMKLVARVLELDTNKLFKGDAVAAEEMIKTELGIDEGEYKPHLFKGKCNKCGQTTTASTDKTPVACKWGKCNGEIEKMVRDKDVAEAVSEEEADLKDLLLKKMEPLLPEECRYKDVDWSIPQKTVWWVTQASSKEQSANAARQIATKLELMGLHGWTVNVCIRDEWDGRENTPWQTAVSK